MDPEKHVIPAAKSPAATLFLGATAAVRRIMPECISYVVLNWIDQMLGKVVKILPGNELQCSKRRSWTDLRSSSSDHVHQRHRRRRQ
jgi:hypothetical protein